MITSKSHLARQGFFFVGQKRGKHAQKIRTQGMPKMTKQKGEKIPCSQWNVYRSWSSSSAGTATSYRAKSITCIRS